MVCLIDGSHTRTIKMKQCEKCLVFFTPPWLSHRNSYMFNHCKKCCYEYYKVLMGGAKQAIDDESEVQDDEKI